MRTTTGTVTTKNENGRGDRHVEDMREEEEKKIKHEMDKAKEEVRN